VVAALIRQITRDPMAVREGFVDSREGGRKLIQVTHLEPMDRVMEEQRSILLCSADRAALEKNRTVCVGDKAAGGGNRL